MHLLIINLILFLVISAQMPTHVFDTFKSTRLANINTVEQLYEGTLELAIAHRFGDVYGGVRDFFGLDFSPAMYLTFDYGLTDNLQVGVGRYSRQKVYEISSKFRLFRQNRDDSTPISMSVFASGLFQTDRNAKETIWFTQLLIARKLNSSISIQISPFLIQRFESDQFVSKVPTKVGSQIAFGSGISLRYRLGKHNTVFAEWSGIINKADWNKNSLDRDQINGNTVSIGYNIEVAGHTFQIITTNTQKINRYKSLMGYSNATTEITPRHFYLGFNITRLFNLN